MLRGTTCLLLALLVVASTAAYPLAPADAPVADALAFLRSSQLGDGSIGDVSVTAWSVMAVAAAGDDPATWKAAGSGASPVDYLERQTHRLRSATDHERQLLAATAAGRDPTQFGGKDLVAAVRAYFDGQQFGDALLLNDDVFAILSLRSAGAGPGDAQLLSARSHLLAHQNPDGGWSYAAAGLSSVDDTAATLWSLHRMGVPRSDPAVEAAFAYLHAQQLPDGGMPSLAHGGTVSNTASDAWAVLAIGLYGEDPAGPAWQSPGTGATLWDNLLSLQQGDGSFQWDGVQRVGPAWMTAYAVVAMLGDAYPVNLQ